MVKALFFGAQHCCLTSADRIHRVFPLTSSCLTPWLPCMAGRNSPPPPTALGLSATNTWKHSPQPKALVFPPLIFLTLSLNSAYLDPVLQLASSQYECHKKTFVLFWNSSVLLPQLHGCDLVLWTRPVNHKHMCHITCTICGTCA